MGGGEDEVVAVVSDGSCCVTQQLHNVLHLAELTVECGGFTLQLILSQFRKHSYKSRLNNSR